jgi:hypothetical protein
LLLILGLTLPPAAAQSQPRVYPSKEKGTYLGILVAPISESLYAQLPQLPSKQGVLVTHILPDSPAARVNLRRHDILLRYDETAINSTDQLARLILHDTPQRKVKLHLLRQGQPVTEEVTLELGPALLLASDPKDVSADGPPRSVAKPEPTPALTVAVVPLERDEFRVDFEYYLEGTGRLHTISYEGNLDHIQAELKKLPATQRILADVVLKRLRKLNTDGRP